MTRPPIRPVELASAGIMAGLTVALGFLATALPVLELALKVAAALPIALISCRFGRAVSVTAVIAAVSVGFGVGGVVTAMSLAQYSLIGWLLGALYRWGSGRLSTVMYSLGLASFITVGKFALLLVFAQSRDLFLDAARVSVFGYLNLLAKVPYTDALVAWLKYWVRWGFLYWWTWIPAQIFVTTTIKILVSAWLFSLVMPRLPLVKVADRFVVSPSGEVEGISPLPMELRGVSHRYGDEAPWVLRDVSVRIDPGEFIVLAGPNGSGKSTLASIVSGASFTAGQIDTPGALGRGAEGGLAYLSQSADMHVVGNTVREDLLWGRDEDRQRDPAAFDALVDECLATVGLTHLADASTRHLSGGELQRLSLAGALLHHPRLIISDETTAMIDPAGRRLMMQIFRDLALQGVAIVHITHDVTEAAQASRLIRMERGRVTFDGPPAGDMWVASIGGHASTPLSPAGSSAVHTQTVDEAPAADAQLLTCTGAGGLSPAAEDPDPRAHTVQPGCDAGGGALGARSAQALWVRALTHVVNMKTPWERTILSDVEFIVNPGESVLITGENGSGKTTLARLMTGLETPAFGEVLLGGKDMWRRVGDVSLSHQFARLQLLRPTVGEDILDAIGGSATHPGTDTGNITGTGMIPDADLHDKRHRSARHTGPVFTDEQMSLISQALRAVGLPDSLAYRGIDELSGGQQRRVALAGLIAAKPAVLILDEPFAGLDAEARHHLINVLTSLRAGGMSLVLISHDDNGLYALADRHYHLTDGRFDEAASTPLPRRRGPRRPSPMRLPQPLPWESPLTRMWAGSKILSWAAVSTMLAFYPRWWVIAVVAAYTLVLTLVGRIPLRAFPNIPAPFWAGIGGGFLGAYMSDGLLIFLRLTVVMLLFLWGTVILLTTTHTHHFTAALSHMLSPLRRVVSNVTPWIHAMSFTVRSIPMLVDQSRALQDTMTIRLYRRTRVTTRQVLAHFVDVTTASLSAAAFRASTMGVAISMRGGIPPIAAHPWRVNLHDVWMAALTLLTVGGGVALILTVA